MDMLTKKIHTKTLFFTHSQIHNGRIDFRQILHIHSLGGLNYIFESPSKLVQEFWEGGVRILASPIQCILT